MNRHCISQVVVVILALSVLSSPLMYSPALAQVVQYTESTADAIDVNVTINAESCCAPDEGWDSGDRTLSWHFPDPQESNPGPTATLSLAVPKHDPALDDLEWVKVEVLARLDVVGEHDWQLPVGGVAHGADSIVYIRAASLQQPLFQAKSDEDTKAHEDMHGEGFVTYYHNHSVDLEWSQTYTAPADLSAFTGTGDYIVSFTVHLGTQGGTDFYHVSNEPAYADINFNGSLSAFLFVTYLIENEAGEAISVKSRIVVAEATLD